MRISIDSTIPQIAIMLLIIEFHTCSNDTTAFFSQTKGLHLHKSPDCFDYSCKYYKLVGERSKQRKKPEKWDVSFGLLAHKTHALALSPILFSRT